MKLFSRFNSNEIGGSLVEYLLILSFIVITAVTAMTVTGTKLAGALDNISNTLFIGTFQQHNG